ncbi:MAG: hypothetical protein Q9187_007996 [Circinaria calcarea]
MPVDPLLCVLLSFGLLSLTLAGPESTISSSSNLSSFIPSCAQSCLEAFIEHSFPTPVCPNPQDLDCLCTSDSKTGFTLGEGALQCVAASCRGEREGAWGNAYGVCLGVGNAKSMTHYTLTATLSTPTPMVLSLRVDSTTTSEATSSQSCSTSVFTPASVILLSSSYSPSTAHTSSVYTSLGSSASYSLPTGITTASGSPSVPTPFPTIAPSSSIGQTIFKTMSTKTSSTTPTSTIPSASSSESPASHPVLSKPQLAGVIVASVATAAIGFAILGLLFCMRRRRERKRDSISSFGCDQMFEHGQDTPIHPRPIAGGSIQAERELRGAPEKAQHLLRVRSKYNENRCSLRRKILQPEDIDVAIAPSFAYDTTQEPSPASFASYKTTSRLLPDKPSLSLFPSTPSPKPSRRPLSAIARSAEGAPTSLIPPPPPPKPTYQVRKPVNGDQAALRQSSEPRHPALRDPFVESSRDPRAMMYALERKRAARAQLPRIVTPSTFYNQGNSATISTNPTFPRHPPPIWPPPECRWEGVLPLSVSNQNPPQKLPSAPAINPDEFMVRPLYQSYHPHISTQLKTTKSASSSRKSSGRRPTTQLTMSSDDTNFDDVDEIVELPEQNSFLSPVVEVRTPLSTVRYPAIPGNAASIAERRTSHTSPTRKPPRRPQYPQALQINGSSNGNDKERPCRPERPLRTDSLLAKRLGPQEAAALTHGLRQGRNLNADIRGSNEDIRGSAKWKVLISPGIEGVEKSVSPRTPQGNRSNERTPTCPSRR